MLQEGLPEYLNLDPTGLFQIQELAHQVSVPSTQRFTIPQICHHHQSKERDLITIISHKIVLVCQNPGTFSTTVQKIGVDHQEGPVFTVNPILLNSSGVHQEGGMGHQDQQSHQILLDHQVQQVRQGRQILQEAHHLDLQVLQRRRNPNEVHQAEAMDHLIQTPTVVGLQEEAKVTGLISRRLH